MFVSELFDIVIEEKNSGGSVVEFHEKLQTLRKERGLTQEELAEALYVSRTAISKWESGRGYPSIESLKEISKFFSVSIDDLLSSEKVLSIAEKENKSNIRSFCDLLFGIVDICAILMIVLPLYPNMLNGYIYSVNLFSYIQGAFFIRAIYWVLYIMLIVSGVVKILFSEFGIETYQKIVTGVSLGISILTVLFLAMTREVYAIIVVFLLLMIKVLLLFKSTKAEG